MRIEPQTDLAVRELREKHNQHANEKVKTNNQRQITHMFGQREGEGEGGSVTPK